MAKKRQADFGKTQLKPGRAVGKRKNITNTSIKSKKIILTKSTPKDKSEKTISECLKNIKENNNITKRIGDLNRVVRKIRDQPDLLNIYLSDIVDIVFKMVVESDDKLRIAAVEVTTAVLQATDDLQLKSFIPHLIGILSCAMTSSASRIKQNSLILLDCVLKTHPNLICYPISILNDLLQMVMDAPRTQMKGSKCTKIPSFSETSYSEKYQINVLGYMNAFLTEMLRSKTQIVDYQRDKKEVYWNFETSSLHLEIYAGGGLEPVDIDKHKFENGHDQEIDLDKIGEFIHDIVKLLLGIFIEEVPTELRSNDNLFSREVIKNLDIIFQVLINVAELASLINFNEMDATIVMFLREKMYNRRKFPFETMRSIGVTPQLSACVQLNLAVCFLYAKFLVLPKVNKYGDYVDEISNYVKKILGKSEKTIPIDIRYNSIPMLIKIVNIFLEMEETSIVSEFLHTTLSQMCTLLKTQDDRPNKKLLVSFFVKLNLEPTYYKLKLFENDEMKNWFNWLLKELKDKASKLDKKFLRSIQKIANCKYPCFLQLLSQLDFNVIKDLLKHDNEEIRNTAICLIYNMKDLSEDILEDLAQLILDVSFPRLTAVRLIRFLSYKFSEKPLEGEVKYFSMCNESGFVDYAVFLLNIAVDCYNLNNIKLMDFDANEYTKAIKEIKTLNPYSIFPSLLWKEHSTLFEVCYQSLELLPRDIVDDILSKVFQEILNRATCLPMHCVIAILKLHRNIQDKCYETVMEKLIFSSLLTTSVLTNMQTKDEFFKWDVDLLLDSIDLNEQLALKVMEKLKHADYQEGIMLYHILRVCKFFSIKQLLGAEHAMSMLQLLNHLKKFGGLKGIIEDMEAHFNAIKKE